MQIARPATGFIIVERPLVLDALATASPKCPWLHAAYSNVKERLRMAGHKSGHMIGNNSAKRYYVEAHPETGENRLVVAYDVLGDTLTIHSLKVLIAI
jgi:hypothetical protein